MINKKKIFQKGSRTYSTTTRFFPKKMREDITTLYAYVRVMDDFVDIIPQKEKEFYAMKKNTLEALQGKITGDEIVDDFIALANRLDFKKEWILAFIKSMEFDLTGKVCKTKKQYNMYVHGSAEVIGLFMAKITHVHPDSYEYAKMLGGSMQLINFIRDVDEDLSLKRWYLPLNSTTNKLKEQTREYMLSHKEEFSAFLRDHIQHYYELTKEAKKGFKYMPWSVRIPMITVTNMYVWTARVIEKNPMIIFEKKVKPTKSRIILNYIQTLLGEAVKR